MPRPVVVVALAFILVPAAGEAQGWELGGTIGGGPSLRTVSLGGEPGHQLYITTLSVAHPLVRWKRFTASYFGEVLPLVIATRVPRAEPHWFHDRTSSDSFVVQFPAGDAPDLGIGAVPVGVRLSIQLTQGAALDVEAAGGGVAFARAMPSPQARSLNFLGSAGVGLRLGAPGHRRYGIGYRFTHLSNANTALENPGFNAHIFYFGITLH